MKIVALAEAGPKTPFAVFGLDEAGGLWGYQPDLLDWESCPSRRARTA